MYPFQTNVFVLTNASSKQLDPSGEMHLIDASTAIRPELRNTWFVSVIRSLVKRFTGPKLPRSEKASSAQNGGTTTTINDVGPDVDSDSSITSSDAHSETMGGSKVKMPTVKAGGMRRKTLRKR
jgi:DnaJ homolog subfamily C member 1